MKSLTAGSDALALFRRGGKDQNVFFRHRRIKAFDGCDIGLPPRQRAGFVKSGTLYFSQTLESVAAPYQYAARGQIAYRRRDRRRRGENHRTRTENHQHRYGADDLAREQPCQKGGEHCPEDDHGRPAVGFADDGRLADVCRLRHADHTGERTVLARFFRRHVKGTEKIDRSSHDFISRAFIHRHGFPRKDGHIYGGKALDDPSVRRDLFTGKNTKNISAAHIPGRDERLIAVPEDTRLVGLEQQKTLNAFSRLAHRQLFQQGAKAHNKSDFSCGERLADGQRRDQSDGNENVRLDISPLRQPFRGFPKNWRPAENCRDPCGVHREEITTDHAENQCKAGNTQQYDVPLDIAPRVGDTSVRVLLGRRTLFTYSFHHRQPLSIPLWVQLHYTYGGIGCQERSAACRT